MHTLVDLYEMTKGEDTQKRTIAFSVNDGIKNSNKVEQFIQIQALPFYTIYASIDGDGSITPCCDVNVRKGDNIVFTINKSDESCYYTSDVLVDNNIHDFTDNVSVGPVKTYEFNDVTADGSIKAVFSQEENGLVWGINHKNGKYYLFSIDIYNNSSSPDIYGYLVDHDSNPLESFKSLAIISSIGKAFGVDNKTHHLYSIDINNIEINGEDSPLTAQKIAPISINDLNNDYDHSCIEVLDINALSFDNSGQLFAMSSTFQNGSSGTESFCPQSRQLFKIDRSNAACTPTNMLPDLTINGLAFTNFESKKLLIGLEQSIDNQAKNIQVRYADVTGENNNNNTLLTITKNNICAFYGNRQSYCNNLNSNTKNIGDVKGFGEDRQGYLYAAIDNGSHTESAIVKFKLIKKNSNSNSYDFEVLHHYYTDELLDIEALDYAGTPITYNISASVKGNGSITPEGEIAVICGEDQIFDIAPASGYKITQVNIDGESFDAATSYTFFKVGDNHTIEAIFDLINYPPELSVIENQTTNEDTATNPIPFTATDKETSYLIVTASSSNISLVSDNNIIHQKLNGINHTLKIEPNPDEYGSTIITVSVFDGYITRTTSFSLEVLSVNDKPIFAISSGLTINEDSVFDDFNAVPINTISAGADNESDQTYEFIIEPCSYTLFKVCPAIDCNGNLTFQTKKDISGLANLEVRLKDNGGTNNGGVNISEKQYITITIAPVNDPPRFDVGNDISVIQGEEKKTYYNWAKNIHPGAYDEWDQTLTFQIVNNSNSDIFSITPVVSINGDLTFTPSSENYGNSKITLLLSDNQEQYSLSNEQAFYIEVKRLSVPEISPIDNQETPENISTGPINFYISDTQYPNDLTVTAAASYSLITINESNFGGSGSNRTLTLTPTTDESGSVTINVIVSNPIGLTDSEMFVLTVHPQPKAKISIADNYTTNTSSPVFIQYSPTNIENQITSWNWDFGDGDSSFDIKPYHTYIIDNNKIEQSYTVTLSVSGPGGVYTDTRAEYINITKPIYVNFETLDNISNGVYPLTVSFINTSFFIDNPLWHWDFGDGSTSTEENPVHKYTSVGNYTVSLKLDDYGQSKTKIKQDFIRVSGYSIKGQITDCYLNNYLNGYMVEARIKDGYLGHSFTDSSGYYIINDLPSIDNITVGVWPDYNNKHYKRFYQNKDSEINANKLSTLGLDSINNSINNINICMYQVPDNFVKGQIVDDFGNGIAGISVEIDNNGENFYAYSDSNGNYTISGIKSGSNYIISTFYHVYQSEFFYSSDNTVTYQENADKLTIDSTTQLTDIDILVSQGGAINGCVKQNNKPINGIWVSAYSPGMDKYKGALTDENGCYTIYGLTVRSNAIPITYIVEIDNQAYPYQAYNSVNSRGEAIPITTGSNNINFNLLEGYNISGTVLDNGNIPVPDTIISAISEIGKCTATTTTNASGQFNLIELPLNNDYIIWASSVDFPIQYFDTQKTYENANKIDLTKGNIENINFVLDKGYIISGQVYIDTCNNKAGEGISVNISSSSQNIGFGVITDQDGKYEKYGLENNVTDYIISIRKQGYAASFYSEDAVDNCTTVYKPDLATYVLPVKNTTIPREILLTKGFYISGKVETPEFVLADNIYIDAWSETNQVFQYTMTQDKLIDGANYKLSGIIPGDYEITVKPQEKYINASKNITVENDNITDVNFVLEEPVRKISGLIFGPDKSMTYKITARSKTKSSFETTSISGSGTIKYEITGLKNLNDYYLELYPSEYPFQFYNGQYEIHNATLIDLTNDDKTNINFDLSNTVVSISGKIYFPDSSVIGDEVCVHADCTSIYPGKSVCISYQSSSSVAYVIDDLLPSQYYVLVKSSRYLDKYYDDVSSEASAAIIDIRNNSQSEINFILKSGNHINGKIIDQNGNSLSGIIVNIYSNDSIKSDDVFSGSDGLFNFGGLDPAGSYIVKAKIPDTAAYYYSDSGTVRSETLATPINSENSPIIIQITPGSSICGNVQDEVGRPVPNINVSISSKLHMIDYIINTSDDGIYCMNNLPDSSDYKVMVITIGYPYVSQIKTNISANSSNIDFILKTGFSFNGLVTSQSQGKPVTNAGLTLSSDNPKFLQYVQTNSSGEFSFNAIPSGSNYHLRIVPLKTSGFAKQAVGSIEISNNFYQDYTLELAKQICGYVYGTISSSESIALSNVSISADSSSADIKESATTDSNGYYCLSYLTDASDYVVKADPATNVYVAKQKTNIVPGSQIDFTLEKGGKISGNVYTIDGQNVVNAKVFLSSEILSLIRDERTDINGYYEFVILPISKNGITINDYLIEIEAENYPKVSKGNKLVGDNVPFILSKGNISGIIKDSNGDLWPANSPSIKAVFVNAETMQSLPIQTIISDGTGTFSCDGLDPSVQYKIKFIVQGGCNFYQFGEWITETTTGTINFNNSNPTNVGDIGVFQFSQGTWICP